MNIMKIKQLFFVLIFLALALSGVAQKNAKTVTKNIIGKWQFESLKIDNEADKIAVTNIMKNSTLEFMKNSTFNLEITNIKRNGVWDIGQKGRLLILGYEKTTNKKRLKTFDIVEITEEKFVWNYYYDGKNLELTYIKIK